MKWQNIVRTVQKGNLISHREGASGCIRNRYRMHYTDLSIIINDVMDQSFRKNWRKNMKETERVEDWADPADSASLEKEKKKRL